ncbi:NHL domain-containing protein [Spongiimicrobium salis]|uniref:NHL domain-containing protein n=1 Tax=Spongiimicrobium salis TaxID=1667022 RepID=UPI00374D57E0
MYKTKYFLTVITLCIVGFMACESDDSSDPTPPTNPPTNPPTGTTNTAPTIEAQSFEASESIASGMLIGTVMANDADGDDLSFSITANDNDLFTITAGDANTTGGQLSVAAGQNLDFETASSHTITVSVSDGESNTAADITITVLDEAENTAPTIAPQRFEVAEDIDDTVTIGTVVATDAEGDNISFSITTNDNGLFELSSGGILSLANGQSLDFETATTHDITVEATDGGMSSSAVISIDVTDVDENMVLYTVSTLAGSTQGFQDGQGTNALFNEPHGVAVDQAGNVYVADSGNHRIRMIDPQGNVTTIAGSGAAVISDGQGFNAAFDFPLGLAVAPSGVIFVSDNNAIRTIDANANVVTIAGNGVSNFEDGPGPIARFRLSAGITVDNNGNAFVADTRSHRIRMIDQSGNVSTIAGNGQGFQNGNGINALFRNPVDVAADAMGNIYVADESNHQIRRIDPNGNVTTFAGSGSGFAEGNGIEARFNRPSGVTVDAQGNVYVTDTDNIRIRRISPNGDVITIAGGNSIGTMDGPGDVASFDLTERIAVDANGVIYVADTRNHRIRRLVPVE